MKNNAIQEQINRILFALDHAEFESLLVKHDALGALGFLKGVIMAFGYLHPENRLLSEYAQTKGRKTCEHSGVELDKEFR